MFVFYQGEKIWGKVLSKKKKDEAQVCCLVKPWGNQELQQFEQFDKCHFL